MVSPPIQQPAAANGARAGAGAGAGGGQDQLDLHVASDGEADE